MKKILFLTILLGFLILAWWYVNAVSTPNAESITITSIVSEEYVPWVEVHLPGVYIKKAGQVAEHPLKTGDELNSGDAIFTDNTGVASIHMPDSSLLRLDVNSEFVLSDFKFDSEKNSLGINIQLKSGRVWSKILSLTGSNSFWNIKTSNAVAAARGTAFGVEYDNGKTFFVGFENTITINGLDLETHEPVINNTAIVGPGKILEINNEDIWSLESGETNLSDQVQEAKPLIFERDWVKRSVLQDKEVDKRVTDLKNGGLPESEVLEELKKDNYEEKRVRSIQSNQAILLNSRSIDSEESNEESDENVEFEVETAGDE